MNKKEGLSIFNGPNVDFPSNKTVIDLFLDQVNQVPENIALAFKDEELSYRKLDELSNKVANYLNLEGIGKDDFVGIVLDRSTEMIISLLGVLKSGAAYVPIDTKYPQSRINYILKDSSIDLVITSENNLETLKDAYGVTPLVLNTDWFSQSGADSTKLDRFPLTNQLAYVIYTSGSTGNPKGVMNEHGSLLNYLLSSSNYINEKLNRTILWNLLDCLIY
jgi:non-ribosomal peptide synthetase component F